MLWSHRMKAHPLIELLTARPGSKPLATTTDPPSRAEAEAAVRTLLRWIGENPEREGLVDTPERVVNAFAEHFSGYALDPVEILRTTFEEVEGFEDLVVLRDVTFESHCEHHLAPIIGKAHLAYLPSRRVVGISKLARLVEVYAKRLQIQERLTAQIADAIDEVLRPRGVAVVVEAVHHCMTTRGVHQTGSVMTTSRLLGEFRTSSDTRREFFALIGRSTEAVVGR
jgi:GTP cyclohydrolase I